MPKIVDHEERRRTLAKAIVSVAAQEGLERATLRGVAKEAGLSMGTVQHYFTDREAMLDFVLEFVQHQRAERIRRAIEALQTPTPAAMLSAMVAEVLATDEVNQTFQKVHVMFVSRALWHTATAEKLRHGKEIVVNLFVTLLSDSGASESTAARAAAEVLWSLMETLPTEIVLGNITSAQALDIVNTYLQQVGVGDDATEK